MFVITLVVLYALGALACLVRLSADAYPIAKKPRTAALDVTSLVVRAVIALVCWNLLEYVR